MPVTEVQRNFARVITQRVVRHWKRLPREDVDVLSLGVLKTRLGGALSKLV